MRVAKTEAFLAYFGLRRIGEACRLCCFAQPPPGMVMKLSPVKTSSTWSTSLQRKAGKKDDPLP